MFSPPRRRFRRRCAAAVAVAVLVAVAVAACGAGLPVSSNLPPTNPSGPSSPAPADGQTPSASPLASPAPSAATPVVPIPLPSPAESPQPTVTGGRAPVGFVLHVPVLMYHRIVPLAEAGTSLPGLVVPPQLFAAQMAALAAAGWHTITAGDLAADLAAGRRPPPRTVVITFDDGYNDGFTYAYPILRAHGFTATYFVVAGRIGRTVDALTPQQVQALATAGMEIGDHTYDHIDLTRVSPSVMSYEITAAAAAIQAIVGWRPVSFAYPFGRYSVAVEAAVRAAGLQIAFTTVGGAWESWTTRFEAPRLRVGPWTQPAALLALLSRYAG